MEILEFFYSKFEVLSNCSGYRIAEFAKNFYIGVDKEKNVVVVIKSYSQNGRPYSINTKALSLECNAKVYFSNGKIENVHILKCLLRSKKEKDIFLEVAKLFINDDYSDKYVVDTFNTLQNFFANKNELSDNELIGFYAELYTIYKFHDSLCIENYWQSQDRLKFDFSFSDTLKLEIKATTKENRIHHFRHEQLYSNYYDIYVLSFLLRYDDEGLSLCDLIEKIRPILAGNKDLCLRLNYIEKNTSQDRLKDLKYNSLYTDDQMRFFSARDIPKFAEKTPAGVSKVEYNCSLDNVSPIKNDDFFNRVRAHVGDGN